MSGKRPICPHTNQTVRQIRKLDKISLKNKTNRQKMATFCKISSVHRMLRLLLLLLLLLLCQVLTSYHPHHQLGAIDPCRTPALRARSLNAACITRCPFIWQNHLSSHFGPMYYSRRLHPSAGAIKKLLSRS